MLAALLILLTGSCARQFEYSILEVRPLASELNAKALDEINALSPKDTFTFFFISDTQVAYDQLQRFVKHVNRLPQDSVAFILHGGDITDYGANFEFNYYYDIIKKLNRPILTSIGNHDMLGNARDIYALYFGVENFSFEYGNTGFIVFNSNSREVAFDGTLPNLPWVESQSQGFAEKDNIIYLSHIAPNDYDYDQSMCEQQGQIIANAKNARLSLHGHTHSYKHEYIYESSIPHVTTPTLRRASFVRVDVEGSSVSVNQEYY